MTFGPPCTKGGAVAKLIGPKAAIQCNLNGLVTTVLLDMGAQISMVSRAWKERNLPDLDTQPMSEIIEEIEELSVYAVMEN